VCLSNKWTVSGLVRVVSARMFTMLLSKLHKKSDDSRGGCCVIISATILSSKSMDLNSEELNEEAWARSSTTRAIALRELGCFMRADTCCDRSASCRNGWKETGENSVKNLQEAQVEKARAADGQKQQGSGARLGSISTSRLPLPTPGFSRCDESWLLG